jgi:cytochrome c biogenesis protein CcdA
MGLFDNNRLIELLSNYLKTQFEIIKLDVQEKLEELLARIFKFILIAFALGITSIFFLLGLANWINATTQSLFIGYFAVAALALIISIILLLTMKKKEESVEESPEQTPEELENHE